ncbi:hypothetical protein L873DRAFT_1918878 [Choiromyces venosus 120613-1]|uniref:Uncharacterized protein n=1 Tax=Choiromyces venosus 120613-1 TaxID=1336337 RepID=A0A3N4JH50_9PEZI|nr:hypothetical protein L873DRAFT_1918878 [Choiromyces venosus 120613-1]
MSNSVQEAFPRTAKQLIFFLYLLLSSNCSFDPAEETAYADACTRFLIQHLGKLQFIMAIFSGPTAIIKSWNPHYQIPYKRENFDSFLKSDIWCLEFLRFT